MNRPYEIYIEDQRQKHPPPYTFTFHQKSGVGNAHLKLFTIHPSLFTKKAHSDAECAFCIYHTVLLYKSFAAHLSRLFKSHNLEHCGSNIAKLAALFKLAGITHNNEGNGIGRVSGEG